MSPGIGRQHIIVYPGIGRQHIIVYPGIGSQHIECAVVSRQHTNFLRTASDRILKHSPDGTEIGLCIDWASSAKIVNSLEKLETHRLLIIGSTVVCSLIISVDLVFS